MEEDRKEFFNFVFNRAQTLEDLIEFYLSYHGPLFNDQLSHFHVKFHELIKDSDNSIDISEYFGPNGEILSDFLSSKFPAFESPYYQSADCSSLEKNIIFSEENHKKIYASMISFS